MKNILTKVTAGVLSAAMLAGCGSGTAKTETETKTVADTVTVQFDADLTTMDAQVATDGNSFIMQTMAMAGLTMLDKDEQIVPDMAESWDVSDDGLTYTFHLRDAKWSNGDPVQADDFVFGFQRLTDPALASEYNYLASTVAITNAGDVISGAKPVTELGVEAKDEKTFVVHLDKPVPFFLGLMAFPSFFPCNRKYYESVGDQYALSIDTMLYNGPYTMTDWQAGNQYTFTKNDDYWDADSIATKNVTFRFVQDTQSAMLSYQQGELDVVKLVGEQVDQYKDTEGYTTRLSAYSWRLDYNFADTTVQNLNLRKAISLAIDRDAIGESVLKDGSIGAKGYIPEQFAYGPDGTDYRETVGTLTKFDPKAASEAYEAAKKELGGDATIELLFEDSEASKAVAENIQQMLQTNLPGITVNLNSKTKKTRLQLMNDKQYQIGLTRWGPDYADPQTYLDIYKSDIPGYNKAYSNAKFDALMNAAEDTDANDPAKRWQDMIDAEKLLVTEDYAVTPVYQNGGAMMVNPSVSGIQLHNAGVDVYRYVKKS